MTPVSSEDPARPVLPPAGSADSGQAEPPPRLAARNAGVPASPPYAGTPAPRSSGTHHPRPGGVPDPDGGPGASQWSGAGTAPQAPAGSDATLNAALPAGQTWTIELPAGLALLSLNHRRHWAQANRIYQDIKKAAWAMTINARVPRLERVEIRGVYDPPDRRHRDGDNYMPSVKAATDGIVQAGRLPGDDARYVARSSCEIGEQVYPRGRLRIVIRDVGAVPPDGAA